MTRKSFVSPISDPSRLPKNNKLSNDPQQQQQQQQTEQVAQEQQEESVVQPEEQEENEEQEQQQAEEEKEPSNDQNDKNNENNENNQNDENDENNENNEQAMTDDNNDENNQVVDEQQVEQQQVEEEQENNENNENNNASSSGVEFEDDHDENEENEAEDDNVSVERKKKRKRSSSSSEQRKQENEQENEVASDEDGDDDDEEVVKKSSSSKRLKKKQKKSKRAVSDDDDDEEEENHENDENVDQKKKKKSKKSKKTSDNDSEDDENVELEPEEPEEPQDQGEEGEGEKLSTTKRVIGDDDDEEEEQEEQEEDETYGGILGDDDIEGDGTIGGSSYGKSSGSGSGGSSTMNPEFAQVLESIKTKRRTAGDLTRIDDDAERFADDLIAKMEAAYKNDHHSMQQRLPATERLKLLNEVQNSVSKVYLQQPLLDRDILGVLGKWLSLPHQQLPNVMLRTGILDMLCKFANQGEKRPGQKRQTDHDEDDGVSKVMIERNRQLTRAVGMLASHPKETLENKKKAKLLIERWKRLLYGVTDDYSQVSVPIVRTSSRGSQDRDDSAMMQRVRLSEEEEEKIKKSTRARTPQKVNFDFKHRPASKVDIRNVSPAPVNSTFQSLEKKLAKKRR